MAKKAIDVEVDFGGVSIGDQTARLGVRLAREHIDIGEADALLCGKRLTGTVAIAPKGEQKQLNGTRPEVSGTFDVKRFGVSPKDLSFGLTFNTEEVDVSDLAQFANRTGRLQVASAIDIPEKQKDE